MVSRWSWEISLNTWDPKDLVEEYIIYIYTHDSQNLYTKGKRGRPVFSRVSSVKFQSKVWFLHHSLPRRFGLCHFNFHRFTWISFNRTVTVQH